MTKRILLAGCGKMGSALLQGWLARPGTDGDEACAFTVFDPVAAETHPARNDPSVAMHTTLPDTMPAPDAIVLAMKPQNMEAALPPLCRIAGRETLWLSIAAGISVAALRGWIGGEAHVIRAMPNTPAAIGRGMTAYFATDGMPEALRELGHRLLAVTGAVMALGDEADMDAVTAVSGSGPAYVFLLCEALEAAAAAAGLDGERGAMLARETITGAARLLEEDGKAAADLRRAVTSPGGTTEAALRILMAEQGGLPALMTRAVLAARKRSMELAKG